MKTTKNAISTMSFIFFAMFLSKILGQVREIVIAYTYGTSFQADAYVAASQIPTNFFDMILGSIVSAAFIPVYNKFIEKDGTLRAKKFAGVFFNVIFLICIIIALLGILFAKHIIKFMAPGLSSEAFLLAVALLKIMFPMVIFIGAAFTFVGFLQSMDEYNIPAIMSIVSSGVCIIYLFTLNNKFGIYGLAVALLIGWILQFLILTPSVLKKKFKFTISFIDSGIKDAVKLALPVVIGTWVQPINVMVNTIIASGYEGGVSSINYANKLYLIASGVFAMTVTNYVFPKLSRLAVSDRQEWNRVFVSSIKTILTFVTPIAIIFMLQSTEIIRVIYERGEFSENSVMLASGALAFYSLGILFYALQEVMYKAFYSKQNSIMPMIIALIGIVINLILSYTLSRFMGINGLAFSASISVIITSVISFTMLYTKNKINPSIFRHILLSLIGGAICAFAVYFSRKFLLLYLAQNTFILKCISLIIPAISGIILYGLFMLIFYKKEGKDER